MFNTFRAVAFGALVVAGAHSAAAQSTGAAQKPASAMAAKRGEASFEKGDRILGVGLLVGDGAGGGFGGTAIGAGAQLEVGVFDFTPKIRLGVGGSVGYTRRSESGATLSGIPVYGIGNVHFALQGQPDLDLYAGVSAGFTRFRSNLGEIIIDRVVAADAPDASYRVVSARAAAVTASSTESGVGLQGGVRYSFGKSFSVQGQLGLGDIPLFFGGVSFKF
jgi:hypothetical protein